MQTNVIHADTRGMSHDEWLAARRHGIGGSDAGAILGVNPYTTPMAVYMDKLGLAPEQEPNEAMRQGTDLEDYVAKRFMEESGFKVKRCNRILQHPEYSFMLANIDRDIIGQDAGLECKTASPMTKYDYDGGEIPKHYYAQVQHYMACTGASKWYLAVLVFSRKFYIFDVPRSESYIANLEAKEAEFWNENVLKKVPPLPTGEDTDSEMINVLYPTVSTDEPIDISTEFEDDLATYALFKAERDKYIGKITEIENKIKLKMGTHSKALTDNWKISWSLSERSSFDKNRMLEEHPELASIVAQYTTTKPQRRFLVSKLTK